MGEIKKETSVPKQEELNKPGEPQKPKEPAEPKPAEPIKPVEPVEDPEKKGEIDYKAKLEEAEKEIEAGKERIEKAESSAQHHRETAEELRKKEPKEEPVTRKDLEAIETRAIRQAAQASVEAEARRIARNPDEAALIIFHYEHSVVPTGSVLKDVARARLIANEGRIEQEAEEIQRTLNSKDNRSPALPSSGKVDTQESAPVLDDDTKKLIVMNKMTWNAKEKVFKNERGVTYNPETDTVFDPRRKK